MSDPRRALLDVNVLIALFNDTHVHHEVAHDWFDDHRAFGWATCALMENGFLPILSPPGADVETDRATLFASLRTFCSSGHHEFWSPFDASALVSHRQLTDVYLLGLATRMGGTLATFDAHVPLHAVRGATRDHLHGIAAAA
jgi:uncharacterized protein